MAAPLYPLLKQNTPFTWGRDQQAAFRTQHPTLVLLQYVDDLLLAAPTALDCDKGTGALLEILGRLGYRASAKKAQICQTKVTYLG